MRRTNDVYVCSFCGKHQYEVELLVAGPNDIFICSKCAETAMHAVLEARIKQRRNRTETSHA